MNIRLGRSLVLGTVTTLVVIAIAAAVVVAAGIVGWEYSNSNAFCTNVCHSVHPEEPIAHAASFHARVDCVECHMGRMSTLQLMAIKPTHINELWGMIVGYERPIRTHSLRPARIACEECHWPEARHNDTVRVKYRYADDPKSTESRTTLRLHTGTGARVASGSSETEPEISLATHFAKGIHWHITQDVDYVALDPGKQKIALVEVRDRSGKLRVSYFDPTAGPSRAEVDKMERRRIDCIDCHNAAGHPFGNPADLVDDAIEEGRIDRSLPSIKTRSDAIIAKANGISGPQAERAAKFAELIAAAAPKGAQDAKTKAAEEQFAAEMKRILLLTSFAAKGITWKVFPNNVGHKDFPGCFRCHDGKHLNDKGEAIRLQCTLCHALPSVVAENGVRTVQSTVSPDLTPPDSHEEPNWMHDHRTQLDSSCAMCHGKIEWGTGGGSFCSNPACHGRKWPEMNLDVQAAAPADTGKPVAPAKPAAPAKSDKSTKGKG
jgi:nitrate/TMAO reductase-like tetraheme cytochrome c subunit